MLRSISHCVKPTYNVSIFVQILKLCLAHLEISGGTPVCHGKQFENQRFKASKISNYFFNRTQSFKLNLVKKIIRQKNGIRFGKNSNWPKQGTHTHPCFVSRLLSQKMVNIKRGGTLIKI